MELDNSNLVKNRIIIILIIIAIIIISVMGVLLANGMLDFKGRKFINLLSKEQYLIEMIESCKDEFYENTESNHIITIKNSQLRQLQGFLGLEKYKIANGDIELSVNVVNDEKNVDSKIEIKTLKNENIEFIIEGDKFAISIPSLFEKYIVLENRNFEEYLKKLFNISGDNKASIEQMEKIIKKYSGVLASSINDYVYTSDKIMITINDNEYETKQYVLGLDSKALNEISNDILNELKDDEETILFITNKINEIQSFRTEFLNEDVSLEEVKNEELKEMIVDLNNNINQRINSLVNKDEILKISLYEYDDKNIKTEIEVINKKYRASLEAIEKDDVDYLNMLIGMEGEEFELEYAGEKVEDSYNGKFNVVSESKPLFTKINVEKVRDSEKEVRKINELDSIILNEASDEEIAALREEIQNNLNIDKSNDEIGGVGDFKLKIPETDADIVENSRLAYTRINPIMTKDEAIKIMGEPIRVESGDEENLQYLYWEQADGIELISVKAKGIKLYNVYNNIAIGTKYNTELSKELGAEIADLNNLISNISVGLSKDEVINILGDKYIEVSKSNLGYISYKWYDKNENNVEIEFDENNKVIQIK